MTEIKDPWSEADSKVYQELATIAVPARETQIASLLTLLPFNPQESFRAAELGCGQGGIAFALLDAFPNASIIALDGSASMRAQTANRLQRFGARASVHPFDLGSAAWLSYLEPADCVLSSLCLHHLPGAAKQRVFGDICARLSRRGAFLIADLIEPQRAEARTLFASTWDLLTESQSKTKTGTIHLFEKFVAEQWNYYRFPDPSDQPSPLFDQLNWLKTAGFKDVDCFWLQAGHAIYGGYKDEASTNSGSLPYRVALQSAHAALK